MDRKSLLLAGMMGKKGLSNILKYTDTPFLCHFDGNTNNLGNGGSIQLINSPGITSSLSKFGTYSLETKYSSWFDLSGFSYLATDKYTVECWIKLKNNGTLMSWGRGGDGSGTYVAITGNIDNNIISVETNTTITTNENLSQFVHIAITYDGNQNFRVFINGKFVNSGTRIVVTNHAGHYSPDVNTIHGNIFLSEYVIHRGIRYVEDFTPLNVPYIII